MQELAFRETLPCRVGDGPTIDGSECYCRAAPKRRDERVQRRRGPRLYFDEQAVIAAVADHTGVSVGKLEQLFHLDNGVVSCR